MPQRRKFAPAVLLSWLTLSTGNGFAAPSEAPSGASSAVPVAPRSSASSLGEDGDLRLAISHYDAGRYELCVDALAVLLDVNEPKRLRSSSRIETARIYHGACLIGVGRTPDAEAVFRDAILENPQMKTPDSLLFPESVVELFLRVRQSLLEEIRKAEYKRMKLAEDRAAREQLLRKLDKKRVEELTKLAENETVVERHHRYLAFLPYGIGQFQNKNNGLGWFFLGSEAAVTAVFVSSLYLTAWYGSKTDDSGNTEAERRELFQSRIDTYLVSAISGWGLLGLSLIGIVEANTSFTGETRHVRKRQLPQGLREMQTQPSRKGSGVSLSWSVSPTADRSGAFGMLHGRF